jgi:hypothetical protein
VLAGLVAVAVLPAMIVLSRYSGAIELLHAGFGIPLAAGLGVLAVILARRARQATERTLGRVGGARAARAGRALGLLGLYLAVTGVLALGFFALLTLFAD